MDNKDEEQNVKQKPVIPLLDIGDADNRKKLLDLMNQGSIKFKDNKGEYYTSVQYGNLYDGNVPVIHKIYKKDITGISVNQFFEFLESTDPVNRKLIRTNIWCRHNNYCVESIISPQIFSDIISSGILPKEKVIFNFIDASNGKCFNSYTNSITVDEIIKQAKMEEELKEKQKINYKSDGSIDKDGLYKPKLKESEINRTVSTKKSKEKYMNKEEVTEHIMSTDNETSVTDDDKHNDVSQQTNIQQPSLGGFGW